MRPTLFATMVAQVDPPKADATKSLNPYGRGTDYPTSIGLGT